MPSVLRTIAAAAAITLAAGGAVPPASAQSDIGFDADRGVHTFAPALAPILPGVVRVIVEVQPEAGGGAHGSGPGFPQPFPGQPPQWGAPNAPPGFAPPWPQDPRQPQQPDQGRPRVSGGSGVIIDAENGLILTNHHVVDNGQTIRVRLTDSREAEAELIGSDAATDIALLQIELDDLTAVPLGDSEALLVGDIVVALGYPLGLDQTVTFGIVSGLGRTGVGTDYEDFIQTDASINPGNSGGALVDSQGRLVGINTAILSRGGQGNIGIGFAVPVRMALAVVEQLQAFGEVRRGRLGVQIQDLTAEVAQALQIDHVGGALITQVTDNSPGSQAGLQVGDIVVRAGDQEIEGATDLRNLIGLTRPDVALELTVLRDGAETTVAVTMRPTDAVASAAALFGASFAALTEDNPMSRFVEGIVVSGVEPDSVAASRGLREGDVVTHINRLPVPDLDALGALRDDIGDVAALTVVRGNSELLVVLEAS